MQFLLAFFRRRPSTEKAVAAFTKAIDQLGDVVSMENGNIDRLDDEIERKAHDRLNAFKRRDRASSILAKLADVVA